MLRLHGNSAASSLLTTMAIIQGGLPARLSYADERRFTFVYEATTIPAGAVEYEQWFTWGTAKDSDPRFDRFDFRHELEIGLSDNLQMGLYLSDWRSQRGDSVDDGVQWRDAAVELKYNLTDPTSSAIGSALYSEVKVGDRLAELEGKIILQKNIGGWIIAWNGTVEAEWEGRHFEEDNGKFEQSLGVSYEVSPKLLVGAELLHEIEYEGWSTWGDHTVYMGPNVSYRTKDWWITAAPLAQVSDVSTEPDFQVRILFGFDF